VLEISPEEIAETLTMITQQHLDIRTVTLGVSLGSCAGGSVDDVAGRVYDRVTGAAEHLVPVADAIAREYGIPIVNKRISVTPVASIAPAGASDLTPIAVAMDRAAREVGVDFIGGFSALVQKGIGDADHRLIDSLPAALSLTERVCASVNVASTRAGINMDAVVLMAHAIASTAAATAERDGIGCAKLVVFCNMVEDNPFMAGAVHGAGEADTVVNVGISGPGVVRAVVSSLPTRPISPRSPRRSRPRRSRSPASGSSSPARPYAGSAWRWASSTSHWPPRPPRATAWRPSSRRSAWSDAAVPARRQRSHS
jgi:hypothetical protein